MWNVIVFIVVFSILIGFKNSLWLLGCIAVGGCLLPIIACKFKSDKTKAVINAAVGSHIEELARKQEQLVVKGEYSVRDTSRWDREKKRFIRDVIPSSTSAKWPGSADVSIASHVIDAHVAVYRAKQPPKPKDTVYSENMSPRQYEKWCAMKLREHGWDAKVTVATGDQGADVIATKGDCRLVVQCKKYTRSVGNKAVQEVHAAKGFYKADMAIVVTNASFTRAAKEAAGMLDVRLIHHDELGALC